MNLAADQPLVSSANLQHGAESHVVTATQASMMVVLTYSATDVSRLLEGALLATWFDEATLDSINPDLGL